MYKPLVHVSGLTQFTQVPLWLTTGLIASHSSPTNFSPGLKVSCSPYNLSILASHRTGGFTQPSTAKKNFPSQLIECSSMMALLPLHCSGTSLLWVTIVTLGILCIGSFQTLHSQPLVTSQSFQPIQHTSVLCRDALGGPNLPKRAQPT